MRSPGHPNGAAAATLVVVDPRYRIEAGAPSIDISVQRIDQLFDTRDPAPFRERDLDPDVTQYILEGAADLSTHDFAIVFWLEHPAPSGELEHAFRAHFEAAIVASRRARRRERRLGSLMFLLAIPLVLFLFTIAQLLGASVSGSLGAALEEGLSIASWVVLWRPAEILIYGWIPRRQERRLVERVLAAKLSVRYGKPPR